MKNKHARHWLSDTMRLCRRGCWCHLCSNEGFTLMEMLIAMSILTVVISLTFSGFRLAGGAWEKGETIATEQQWLRVAPEIIYQQLMSISPYGVYPGDKKNPYKILFKGDSGSLFFSATVSLFKGADSEIFLAHYKVDDIEILGKAGKMLSFAEVEYAGGQLPELESIAHYNLFNGHEISFSYLAPQQGDSGDEIWLSEWSGENKGLPGAVKITMQQQEKSPPLVLIVPISVATVHKIDA